MSGITMITVLFGFVLIRTVTAGTEEDLQARVVQLESQVRLLTQHLGHRDEEGGKPEEQKQSEVLELPLSSVKYLQPDKRSHFLDLKAKLHPQRTPDRLETNKRLARSTDPVEVAFTAKLSQTLNNVASLTTIKFDYVTYDTGNHYNPVTGVFTCPTSGLYLFAVFVETHSVGVEALVRLKMDGKAYMSVVSERSDPGEDDTGGNIVLLPVNKGQRVWVETYHHDNQSFWEFFSTFSAVLIHSP